MAQATHPDGFPDALVADALAAARALPARTPVFAISGLQGSGKSTLAAQIGAQAEAGGLRVAILSPDDLYLTRDQRRLIGFLGLPHLLRGLAECRQFRLVDRDGPAMTQLDAE